MDAQSYLCFSLQSLRGPSFRHFLACGSLSRCLFVASFQVHARARTYTGHVLVVIVSRSQSQTMMSLKIIISTALQLINFIPNMQVFCLAMVSGNLFDKGILWNAVIIFNSANETPMMHSRSRYTFEQPYFSTSNCKYYNSLSSFWTFDCTMIPRIFCVWDLNVRTVKVDTYLNSHDFSASNCKYRASLFLLFLPTCAYSLRSSKTLCFELRPAHVFLASVLKFWCLWS